MYSPGAVAPIVSGLSESPAITVDPFLQSKNIHRCVLVVLFVFVCTDYTQVCRSCLCS